MRPRGAKLAFCENSVNTLFTAGSLYATPATGILINQQRLPRIYITRGGCLLAMVLGFAEPPPSVKLSEIQIVSVRIWLVTYKAKFWVMRDRIGNTCTELCRAAKKLSTHYGKIHLSLFERERGKLPNFVHCHFDVYNMLMRFYMRKLRILKACE